MIEKIVISIDNKSKHWSLGILPNVLDVILVSLDQISLNATELINWQQETKIDSQILRCVSEMMLEYARDYFGRYCRFQFGLVFNHLSASIMHSSIRMEIILFLYALSQWSIYVWSGWMIDVISSYHRGSFMRKRYLISIIIIASNFNSHRG